MNNKPLRILLLENYDADSKKIINTLNEEKEWKIFQVNTLQTGLEYLQRDIYHVILADLNLPDSSGLNTLEKILLKSPNAPVILLSGKTDEKTIIEAIHNGAQDFLLKEEINQYNLKRIITFSYERNLLLNRIREKEQKYRMLAENTNEWIWEVNQNGEFTFSNDIIVRLLGYRPDEILGRSFGSFMTPEDQLNFDGLYLYLTSKKEKFSDEWTLVHKSGSTLCIELFCIPIYNSNKTFFGFRGKSRDISERKQIDELFREKYRLFSTVVRNCSHMLLILDKSGLINFVNPSVRKVLEFELEDMIGKFIFIFIHPDDIPQIVYKLNNPDDVVMEIRIRDKHDNWHTMKVSNSYLMDNGEIKGLIINAVDITEFSQTINLLKKNEGRFRSIIENQDAFVCEVSHDFNILYINRKGMEIIEYTSSDLMKGVNFLDIVKEEDQTYFSNAQNCALTGERPVVFECRLTTKSSHEFSGIVISCFKTGKDSETTVWYTIADIGQYCAYTVLPDMSFYQKNNISAVEIKIINYLLQGLKIKQIAKMIFISEPTVKAHITSIYRKLNISSREMLIQLIKGSSRLPADYHETEALI